MAIRRSQEKPFLPWPGKGNRRSSAKVFDLSRAETGNRADIPSSRVWITLRWAGVKRGYLIQLGDRLGDQSQGMTDYPFIFSLLREVLADHYSANALLRRLFLARVMG